MGYYEMRLFSEEHFNQIIECNEDNPIFSESSANHLRWVKSAVNGLKGDDYRRIAFGVFKKVSNHTAAKLVCSVIINKNDFSKKLALKNLIFHGIASKAFSPYCEERRECYVRLINHVKKFAATRGYEKLSSELISLYSNDKSLVQAFLECGFTISGNKNDLNEEWVYLDCSLSSLYSNDPFDYRAICAWILKSYIHAAPVDNFNNYNGLNGLADNKAELYWVSNDNPRPLDIFKYKLNSTSEPLLSEFNTSIYVMILQENVDKNNRYSEISKIIIELKGNPRLYIFSFCNKEFIQKFKEKLPESLMSAYNIKIIGSDTINKLISSSNFNSRNGLQDKSFSVAEKQRFSFDKVHGLLSIADPDRISISEINAILNAGQKPVYIKLGAKGRYLQDDDYLVLAYYGDCNEGRLCIWAVLELNKVEFVDLNKQHKVSSGFDKIDDEADYVFNFIEEKSECELSADEYTLWTRKAFRKHNKLNPINQVLCCWICKVFDFRESPLPLEQLTGDSDRIEEIHEWNDSYLTEDELANIGQLYQDYSEGTIEEVNTSMFPCSLTFLHSSPKDLSDIEIKEGIHIENAIINRIGLIQEDGFRKHINLDVTSWELFAKKINRGIVHFSGHGEEGKIFISCDGGLLSHPITLNKLEEFIQKNTQQISMFIFNCCRSSGFAQMVSRYCGLAIGYKNDLPRKTANNFTETFYFNLGRSNYKNNTTLTTLAFALDNTIESIGHLAVYELWHNGKLVDLKKEKSKYVDAAYFRK